ncbi:uncharacterized protein ARMOST_15367 [Armillaria ostoyae]|uniref:Uncharacterized protein n=1 Tax=Armillaria ostoyae TaxID=47428 RepID=A0A284RT54_ARMOS|nr:uncharacterized protein ARMOST_15367 [Armillaria ostoyae]
MSNSYFPLVSDLKLTVHINGVKHKTHLE